MRTIITNMINGGYSATSIANNIIGKVDSAAVSQLITEMRRLGFTEQQINYVWTSPGGGGYTGGNNNGNGSGNNNSSGNNNGGNANQVMDDPTVTVKKGVIYNAGGKAFGLWDGKEAYVINSKGKLVKNASWTKKIINKYKALQSKDPKIKLTKVDSKILSKVISFVKSVED